MAAESVTGRQPVAKRPRTHFLTGRRGRKVKEALLAYALLFPAFLIILVFGIFPLAFSAYQSTLRGLNKIVGTYDGLSNYVRALDNLAYVLMFWLAIVFFYLAIRGVVATVRLAREYKENPWGWSLSAAITVIGLTLFARFFFTLLPQLLMIPQQVPRGQQLTRELFRQLLVEAWRVPEVQSSLWAAVVVLLVAVVAGYLSFRFLPVSPRRNEYFAAFVQAGLLLMGAVLLGWLTWTEIQKAYAEALEAGESLEIWTQLITISAGAVLLIISWYVWRSATGRSSTIGTFLRMGAAVLLVVGAWVLIAELPRAVASGNKDWWQALQVTVFFALFTIPMQFAISLTLATILFQNIKGKEAFRMIFFLPFIAPLVGTAAAFRIIFSGRANAPVNSMITALGFQPLGWLNEPAGIFQMMVGSGVDLPTWMAGPSLALLTIILYNVWTYVGFDMVIFLAGLGSIPGELYEAASIDGAGRWSQFRHVTIPLLSPTIYFLMLLAVIGTFKAFNRIYVMRLGAALGTTDTASVVIFETFNRDTRYGYASALAMILLVIIVILTVVNNRVAEERVFYG